MKSSIVVKFTFLFVASLATPTYAGTDCISLEFTELQSMSKKELLEEYCQNIVLGDLSWEYAMKYLDLGALDSYNKSRAEALKCRGQAERINKIAVKKLKKGFDSKQCKG